MENGPFKKDDMSLPSATLCRARDAISTELDGETVILNIETGVYNGLDQVGTTIWNLLEQPISFAALSEGIMAEYEVEAERCKDDLCRFLNDMVKNRLVEIQTGAPAEE